MLDPRSLSFVWMSVRRFCVVQQKLTEMPMFAYGVFHAFVDNRSPAVGCATVTWKKIWGPMAVPARWIDNANLPNQVYSYHGLFLENGKLSYGPRFLRGHRHKQTPSIRANIQRRLKMSYMQCRAPCRDHGYVNIRNSGHLRNLLFY